ncbi:DNA adenine methylase [Planktothrix sp. FACHB-1355]|uniref:Site-specific DNA-methyltransferase (adenine-specific) n=1 Tax=Aerosakkonema funiforme FACHB-1375 TaxID=2949571 RepID=A0A926VFP2_9CYAN|nr:MULTISPECIES: DNA adenine methylase [Oscillatoriales]MBD2182403.1 DNA adenine methylase [Aerosakkonema funiforme FACHB-1375]MBD3558277.1 DNA adenine methylase [Planktothrix sp. FACHB-1355]
MSTTAKDKVSPRPFLKWAGGKSKLIAQYETFFPKEFQTYYEPFLGGGAVFFYLKQTRPEFKAILTDINADLINTYICVRDRVKDLIACLEEHQQRHNSDYYYDLRNCHTLKGLEAAARFIYLNKTCFNGLYRVNPKGEFNVPVGKYKNPKISNPDLLYTVSEALQGVEIAERSFEAVLDYAKTSNDFVYFDPPYYPLSNTSEFTAYTRDAFRKEDQIRLKEVFAKLASQGVKVMLSNSDCEFIRELYKDFNIEDILAARYINSNAKKRGMISEVLISASRDKVLF